MHQIIKPWYKKSFGPPDEYLFNQLPKHFKIKCLKNYSNVSAVIIYTRRKIEYIFSVHKGAGTLIINAMLSEYRFQGIQTIYLECLPKLVPYYKRWNARVYKFTKPGQFSNIYAKLAIFIDSTNPKNLI